MNFSVRLIQIYILCQVYFPLNNAASSKVARPLGWPCCRLAILVGWQAIFRFKAPELL